MLQEQILSYLEKNRDEVITGGQIARELGVSRTAVWKAIHALRKKGHDIATLPNSGYRMQAASDGLSRQGIEAHLSTKKLGRPLELMESVPSTNTYIKGLDTASVPEGFAVVANEQTGGRGRLGRTFHSPAHEGVYLSVLLKPELDLHHVPLLTVCAAVAVSQAVEQVCAVSTSIKWVNDIYVQGKKLCGILSEAFISAELRTTEYVIVGIGINTGAPPADVKDIATSIQEITGRRGLRNRLIAEVLNQFEKIYLDFLEGEKRAALLSAYSAKLLYGGREVMVAEAGASYTATVLGIDETGALLVRLPEGIVHRVIAGEIRIPEKGEGRRHEPQG